MSDRNPRLINEWQTQNRKENERQTLNYKKDLKRNHYFNIEWG